MSYVHNTNKIVDFDLYIDKNALNDKKAGENFFSFSFRQHPNWKYHYRKGLEPYAATWNGTIYDLKNQTGYGCYASWRSMCAKLIQMNSWQFPDDYPWL